MRRNHGCQEDIKEFDLQNRLFSLTITQVEIGVAVPVKYQHPVHYQRIPTGERKSVHLSLNFRKLQSSGKQLSVIKLYSLTTQGRNEFLNEDVRQAILVSECL